MRKDAVRRFVLVPISMIAIALFLADSIITPGVTVLSAVEGLESLWPKVLLCCGFYYFLITLSKMEPFSPYLAICVLIVLYFCQRFGTGKVCETKKIEEISLKVSLFFQLGGVFGPIMLCYFLAIGTLGLSTIALLGNWGVLRALNPLHSVFFMWADPGGAWLALQSVVLAVTGAEALYADMGHFGRPPIQLAWHAVVLPCLIFSYLGQGAVVS
jgi:KUP system potassium uptake protein